MAEWSIDKLAVLARQAMGACLNRFSDASLKSLGLSPQEGDVDLDLFWGENNAQGFTLQGGILSDFALGGLRGVTIEVDANQCLLDTCSSYYDGACQDGGEDEDPLSRGDNHPFSHFEGGSCQ